MCLWPFPDSSVTSDPFGDLFLSRPQLPRLYSMGWAQTLTFALTSRNAASCPVSSRNRTWLLVAAGLLPAPSAAAAAQPHAGEAHHSDRKGCQAVSEATRAQQPATRFVINYVVTWGRVITGDGVFQATKTRGALIFPRGQTTPVTLLSLGSSLNIHLAAKSAALVQVAPRISGCSLRRWSYPPAFPDSGTRDDRIQGQFPPRTLPNWLRERCARGLQDGLC